MSTQLILVVKWWKVAVVRYDATKLSPEKIIAAIDQTGFKAEPATPKENP